MNHLKEQLRKLQDQPLTNKVLIGFDGYVDLIQKVVKSTTKETKQYYSLLADVGSHISAASGKSAQLEVCTITKKLGGNAPIMATGMEKWFSLGVDWWFDQFNDTHLVCCTIHLSPCRFDKR